jgi:hypothetical protein
MVTNLQPWRIAAAFRASSVVELAAGGKSNAWNRYVHEFSRRDADFIVMVDADIEFGHPHTIRNSIEALAANPGADVVVDQPLNSIVRKETRTLFERVRVKLARSRLIWAIAWCGRATRCISTRRPPASRRPSSTSCALPSAPP